MKPKDLKRWTKREDMAETVVHLASPAAAGVTGQVNNRLGWPVNLPLAKSYVQVQGLRAPVMGTGDAELLTV
jgi:hypothetical protein